MKTGKKVLTWVLVILLVLIAAVVILINVFGDRAVKMGVVMGAEQALKVDVRLESASLSILGGTLGLKQLEIDNPEGYQNPNLMTVGNTFVAVNIGSLMSDTVEIEKIQLDNVSLTIEQKGLTNNLQEILKNLPKADAPSTEPGKNLRIKELQINGVEVTAKLLPVPGQADNVKLKLAPMTLTNLGTEEELDIPKLTSIVLTAIVQGVMEQGKDLLPLDMINDLGKGLVGVGQEVLEQATDVGKGIIEGAGDIGKGAGEALKGLFEKKE